MGGLEAIDPRYAALYERTREVLGTDPRVKAVEVSGSVASGTADEWSDLDLVIVTHEDGHDEFLGDWPRWLAEITPTVFARAPIAPFIINSVTNDGLTLDLAVYKGEPFRFPTTAGYTVGMLSGTRFPDLPSALQYAVEEMLRGTAGPFITFVMRGEHLRHMTGVPHILGLLTTVFVAELGGAPLGKQWNRSFTAEQLAAVASLPPVSATREGVVGFGLGVAELVVTRARPLYARFDLEWPAGLAAVAAERVGTYVGVDVSSWLH